MNVPAIGKVKKQWVIIGLAVSAGIVGYAWWKNGKGQPAASEGDVTADDLAYTGVDSFRGAVTAGGSTVSGTVPGEGPPLTNAEWTQRVVDLLEGVGFDRNFAAATIGKYLAGNPLTTAEAILVQTALGLLGNPPAGALPIIKGNGGTTDPPPSGGSGGTGGVKTTWQGHKVTADESRLNRRQFAAKYAGSPGNATSVESTLRAIRAKNPAVWLASNGTDHFKAGWIVLVPVHK